MVSWSREPDPQRGLPGADVRLAAEAFVFAVAAPLIARLPLERQAALLNRSRRGPHRTGRSAPRGRTPDDALRVTDAVLRRGRPLVRSGCLTRAMTRYWCLERTGNDVELCFGVAWIDDRIEGHCWVRSSDGPLREPEDADRFREMFRIGPEGVREVAS